MITKERYLQTRQLASGLALVVIALPLQFTIMGVAILFIGVGLVVAFGLWVTNRWDDDPSVVLPPYLLGVGVMCLHSLEEYLTGFQREFPTLFGYQWSDQRFVAFNLIWVCIFILAAVGVLLRVAVAYLIVIFFALVAGLGNGIGHIVLSIAQGRYFPGLITAPFLLILGVILVRRLFIGRKRTEQARYGKPAV